jgi:prepilin-type N-terminal cleavage/methylation domain-containing protein
VKRGLTLLELLVAVVLLGLLGSMASGALRGHERSLRARADAERAARVAHEVVGVGEALLGSATTRRPPTVLGDTAIEWWQDIGRGLSCAAGGDSLLLPLAHPAVWWGAAPDTTDQLTVETAAGQQLEWGISTVRQRPPSPACPRGAWRLQLSWPTAAQGVLLVHIARRTRLVTYRAGDGQWWWGERRCPADLSRPCGPSQPITGPLSQGRSSVVVGSAQGLTRLAVQAGPSIRRGSAVVVTP